jgi:hypothetical protein
MVKMRKQEFTSYTTHKEREKMKFDARVLSVQIATVGATALLLFGFGDKLKDHENDKYATSEIKVYQVGNQSITLKFFGDKQAQADLLNSPESLAGTVEGANEIGSLSPVIDYIEEKNPNATIGNTIDVPEKVEILTVERTN